MCGGEEIEKAEGFNLMEMNCSTEEGAITPCLKERIRSNKTARRCCVLGSRRYCPPDFDQPVTSHPLKT